jgi:ABC-2 type transport system ATP-binding protein
LILSIKNITKQYDTKIAVNSISFELTQGIYGLLGPNGSGKTSLIRILASVAKPTTGSVLCNGEDITVLDERYRSILGYLPQQLGVYNNFTGEKFLLYIASLKGLTGKEAKVKVNDLLEIVGLSKERNLKLGTYSGGMKQRIGIAQALINDPKVLIVDEPTAGLDPKERNRFRNLLSSISKNRIVLISTHIVSDIEYIAKEILMVKDGFLIAKEEPNTLLKELEGKVWTMSVGEDDAESLQKQLTITGVFRKSNDIILRIISDELPGEDAILVEPNLEDLYLYNFGEE